MFVQHPAYHPTWWPPVEDNPKFEPRMTPIWKPVADMTLFIGGSRAGDDEAYLNAHNVCGKLCSAGTKGWDRYKVIYMKSVEEFDPLPSNQFLYADWEEHIMTETKRFCEFWKQKRRVLIYCKMGANRSAQQVVLLMCVGARCRAREVLSRGCPETCIHLT